MGGMTTLDTASAAGTYACSPTGLSHVKCFHLQSLAHAATPRFVASNKAEMWWISEHEGTRSVLPNVVNLEHITINTTPVTRNCWSLRAWTGWFHEVVRKPRMASDFTGLATEHGFDVVLPLDPLSMETHVWRESPPCTGS